jgi:hypothetical protein
LAIVVRADDPSFNRFGESEHSSRDPLGHDRKVVSMLENRGWSRSSRSSRLQRLAIALVLAWLTAELVGLNRSVAEAKDPPTYTKDVAPILQTKCQNCHRRHQAGPFALETYEQARKRAGDIATVSTERSMPPWKPAAGVGPKLKHDQSLSRDEIAILHAWAEAGAPKGDPKDMPAPANFVEGWKLGPPDLILEPAEDFAIPAQGKDTYRCFVIPTNLVQDAYISAIDFRPGSPSVVHHINAFLDTTGDARLRDQAEPGPGYTSFGGPGIPSCEELCFWATGHVANHFPPGIAQRLTRQSDLIVQIHYHPSGKPEVDRTRVGIYFSREPVKQALHWNAASNTEFQLPAGKDNIEIKASWYIPADLEALAISPHMHSLGRDMRITLTYPNGKTEDLIQIPVWDPAWQGSYHFQKPISLPQGSIVKVIAHYDNSAHARNPNQPPKRVKRGFTAGDEMCEGFLAVVKKGQDLTTRGSTDDLAKIFGLQRQRNAIRKANSPR